jgi:hypothetical protein
MRFLLLLALLASKFKKSSQADPNFKKFLMGHECRIVIKTNDKSVTFFRSGPPTARHWRVGRCGFSRTFGVLAPCCAGEPAPTAQFQRKKVTLK